MRGATTRAPNCPRLPLVVSPERLDDAARLRETLARIAPGTSFRDGLERILRGRTGALIVVGHDKEVEGILTGGFTLDVPFTATALRELAKMDGAIVLDREISRIHRANVHLMPDHTIPSEETGTRHRTADRVAKQTGAPVISVSQSMQIIAVYVGAIRYVLEDSGSILARANQALATLERYKVRLDEVSSTLSALEIEDLVTVRDVAVVAQRLEMVSRIAREIDDYVNELGTDGRLLSLQLEELVTGVDAERTLVIRDYQAGSRRSQPPEELLADLEGLSPAELVDIGAIARALGLGQGEHLDGAVTPRGHRLLAKVPRLPPTVVDRLVEHFETLQKLLSASVEDLQMVEGVGELRARSVREGLSRLAESSILERYV
jgi:diadenylate cyclase